MFVKSINHNPGDMQHTVRRCQNNDKETNYVLIKLATSV